jgi:hypothetical protein
MRYTIFPRNKSQWAALVLVSRKYSGSDRFTLLKYLNNLFFYCKVFSLGYFQSIQSWYVIRILQLLYSVIISHCSRVTYLT